MKKLFFTLLTLCLCGTTWAASFSQEDPTTGVTFYYNYVDMSTQTVEVTYPNDSQPSSSNHSTYTGAISIPASVTHDGVDWTVVGIGDHAFYWSSITSLVIPESVTSIGEYAFYYCTSLSGNLSLPESLTSLGTYAFYSCTSLTGGLTIPSGITTIENYIFCGCTGLSGALTIPVGVTSIGTYAFENCSSLSGTLSIPEGVTSIGDYAFYNCRSFTNELAIPTGVTSIGRYTFYGCSGFTSVTLPNSLTTLDAYAFHGCTSLTSVVFSRSDSDNSSITQFGMQCFYGCSALSSITLPISLTDISSECFRSCTSLTEITIPKGVTTYGYGAFYGCTNLKSVILLNDDPSSDTFSGNAGTATGTHEDVFYNDSGITFYVPRGSAAKYVASYWETEVETDGDSFNFFALTSISEDSADEEGYYYATYYYDGEEIYEIESPETSEIYAITGASGGVATTQDLRSENDGVELIPKGIPLLIQSTVAGTYYLWWDYYGADGEQEGYHSGLTPTAITNPEGNMLYGHSTSGVTSAANGDYDSTKASGYLYYKLSLNSSETPGSVGFYWGAEGGYAYTASANKCWLAVPETEATSFNSISFKKDEGDTTGISSVESAVEGATVKGIYTIQGVRVSNMNQSGLYIVDGKKVLVK